MKKTANALASLNTKKLLVCTLGFLALNNVHAATLGKMKVLSVLGANLKAEIELTNILPEEEANLVVKIAPPDVFKRAGLEYNPALANIKATINKNSRPLKITLSSQAAISEPLLEVLMDLNWQSGRLVRQYTMLLDPASSTDDTADVLSNVPVTSPQVISSSTSKPVNISKPVLATEQKVKTKRQAVSNEPNGVKRVSQKYTVKKGDTLYLITRNLVKGNTAQINQLMKLLVKNNPNSFINNDKNRLKSGVVLNTRSIQKVVPNSDKTDDKTDDKALSNVAASKDFSRYKQAAANQLKVIKKDSTASKIVRNSVKTEVSKPLETIQDQLKVSGKAAIGTSAVSASIKKNEESKIAEERAKIEERAKLALLKKTLQASVNITNNTLASVESKLESNNSTPVPKNETPKPPTIDNLPVVATVAATAVIAPPVVTSPQIPVAIPNISDVPSLIHDSDTPVETLSKPAEVKPAEAAIVSSNNQSNNQSNNESSSGSNAMIDWFAKIDALTLGGVATGLLGAIWLYFKRKKQKELQNFSDTQFNINDTQGTLLTADGGQAVDTFNSVFASTFSEMNNSESSEVDPVAEADVYMQYGRDAHAEDILKDALKQSPNRIPVHLKLMEIYANKSDHVALKEHFNAIANLTQSSGEEWEQAKAILNQSLVHPSSISELTLNKESASVSKGLDIKDDVKNNIKNLTGINSNNTGNFDYSNSATLKNKLPDISLSSPTQIGDVPTTINMNANLRANKKPENIVINGNINGNSNVKDALNMNVLKLDTPVSLISPASNINERVLQPSVPTQLMTSNSILNFDIQTPTLISLPTSATGVLKNTQYNNKSDNKFFINKTIVPSTLSGATLIKKNILDDTNFTSTTDFKLSKNDNLEINSILDKVTDDMQLGSNNINSGTQAIETKFSLAQAYLEIGDKEGAKELLNEVLKSGHQALSEQARAMLSKI